MGRGLRTVLFWFRYLTNSTIPPLYWNSWDLLVRSSRIVILRPLFRNASSRIRWVRTSKLNSIVSKISSSGLKVILVPVFFGLPDRA